MKDIVITSDSTCDLSADLVAANDIRIMPLSVMLGGKTFRDGGKHRARGHLPLCG